MGRNLDHVRELDFQTPRRRVPGRGNSRYKGLEEDTKARRPSFVGGEW